MNYKEKFNTWIDNINLVETPPVDIIAFWFGLIETTVGYEIYLIGSKKYDKNDDDWACFNDFEPQEKYLKIPTQNTKNKDWETILADSISIIKGYVETDKFMDSIFKNSVAVAVGFDSGDLHLIK